MTSVPETKVRRILKQMQEYNLVQYDKLGLPKITFYYSLFSPIPSLVLSYHILSFSYSFPPLNTTITTNATTTTTSQHVNLNVQIVFTYNLKITVDSLQECFKL